MKKLIIILLCALGATTFSSYAFDIKGALKKAAGNDTTKTSGKGGGILDAIGSIVGGGDVSVKDIQGNWKYVKPAISFKSDNLLKKAGGIAAAEMIESKLTPYYQTAGVTSMTLTVNASDSTFVMGLKHGELKGTISKIKDSEFQFNFKALGAVNIGTLNAEIKKAVNNITVTFDATKLMSLVSKIAAITKNSTAQTVSSLLNSYDGLQAGFELKPSK